MKSREMIILANAVFGSMSSAVFVRDLACVALSVRDGVEHGHGTPR